MTDGERLAALGVFMGAAVYAIFATADIPIVTGGARRLPNRMRQVHDALVNAFPAWTRSKGRALMELSIVVVFTQLMPVILLTASAPRGPLRGIAALELVLAAAWAAYLVGAGRNGREPRPPA